MRQIKINRRSFIRWIISSGAMMACPVSWKEAGASGAPAVRPIPPGSLGGEGRDVCHRARDHEPFPMPVPSRAHDLVIVGGGPSGLAAADEAKNSDFLLLEKEPHLGGNAFSETWEGLSYSTGSAWTGAELWPEVKYLENRWDLGLKPIEGEDSACFNGKWIRNFWNGKSDNPAFRQLPYSESTKKGFRQFIKDWETVDLEKEKESLDSRAFSEILGSYPPELRSFWDGFGLSDWGGDVSQTSAYVGLQAAVQWFRDRRATWPGGLGIGSRKIFESLPPEARSRVWTGASAYRVRKHGNRAWVSFFHEGKPQTIEARSVVVAVPKFFARILVEGLPEEQASAMASMRYAPYMVYNLCFDRVVYNQGYDNWVVGAKNFTDFIPADWVEHGTGGDLKRKQVITVYAPRHESERSAFLDDSQTLAKAQAAVAELAEMFPGWVDHLREVRIYRRGHPMPISAPGYCTRLQPQARRDFPPIYFAHSDSKGAVSDFFAAADSGIQAAKKALSLHV